MMGRIPLLAVLLLAGALVSCFGGERMVRFTSWDRVQVDEGQVLPYKVLSSGQGEGWLVTKRIEIQGRPGRHQVLNTLLSVLKESGERRGSSAFAPGSAPARACSANAIMVIAHRVSQAAGEGSESVATAIWGPEGEFREPLSENEPYAIRITLGPRKAE